MLNTREYALDVVNSYRKTGAFDELGIPEIPEAVLAQAESIIRSVVIVPEVYPTGRSTLQLEFHGVDKKYLEFELYLDRVVMLYLPREGAYNLAVEKEVIGDEVVALVSKLMGEDLWTMSEEAMLYKTYIDDHRANVQKAFEVLGESLCTKLDVDLEVVYKLVNAHDLSKYLDEEFNGYRQWFYPREGEQPSVILFEEAWKHHYFNNKHHPEHWLNQLGEPDPMSKEYIVEMLLDWVAMSLVKGDQTISYPVFWYLGAISSGKLKLNKDTKEIVDSVLPIFAYGIGKKGE